jgi:hypothetical protein
MTTYKVFKRKVYRLENGEYVPNPSARRFTLYTGVDIDTARDICKRGPANKALEAGKEYRGLPFYEFESE